MTSLKDRLADESDDYLDKHDVYGLFASLLKQLTIAQPSDPYPFLIAALQKPTTVLRCIVTGSGAPGTGGSRALQLAHAIQIASAFGVPFVSADELVKDAITKNTKAGATAKAALDAKRFVDDDTLAELVQARLTKPDCQRNGWVLVGFPNSRTGAQQLAHTGLLATHFLYFANEARAASASAVTAAVPLTAKFPAVSPSAATQHVREFYAHVTSEIGAAHVWPDIEKWLSSTTAAEAGPAVTASNPIAIDSAAGAVSSGHSSTAAHGGGAVIRPRRPLRIAILGPRGAGKSTQAALLSQSLGVIHVSSGQLLRAEVNARSTLAAQIQPYIAAGLLVPDDIVTSVVGARLLQSDCKRHGFLLDGYPQTSKQVAALAAASCLPRRVIILQPAGAAAAAAAGTGTATAAAAASGSGDSKVLLERLIHRRLDPITGHFYHIKTNSLPPQPIGGRLVFRSSDSEEFVKTAIKHFNTNIADVQKALKAQSVSSAHTLTVDATLPADAVTTAILQHIHNPLNAQIVPIAAEAAAAAAAEKSKGAGAVAAAASSAAARWDNSS